MPHHNNKVCLLVLRALRVRHLLALKFKQCWLLKNKQDNNNLTTTIGHQTL
jgi:hypothetical protein